jgi:ribose 5-phosphate isomerase RpiB
MKIAVINEISACAKNQDILQALDGYGHEIINLGMKDPEEKPSLTYLHTGFLAGYLLNKHMVDLVVGGCGTGMGFMLSAMMYPNVFCGLIQEPLDALLFARINAGNCVSLALNKGYGWGGVENLKMIFYRLFTAQAGAGYPEHRKESQEASRKALANISCRTHKTMDEIIKTLDETLVQEAMEFPSVVDFLKIR